MKTVKTCAELGPMTPTTKEFRNILPGTIFRYGSYTCGPYLAVNGGMVDLKENAFLSYAANPNASFSGYKELTDAVLVLNEKP